MLDYLGPRHSDGIRFRIDRKYQRQLNDQGYHLSVTHRGRVEYFYYYDGPAIEQELELPTPVIALFLSPAHKFYARDVQGQEFPLDLPY